VTIKFVYTPGYTGDNGCRLYYVNHRNKAELNRHLQNMTSEGRSSEIVRNEYERLKNFNEINYGQLEEVGRFKNARSRLIRYPLFRLREHRTKSSNGR
jgi:hypothetical protein